MTWYSCRFCGTRLQPHPLKQGVLHCPNCGHTTDDNVVIHDIRTKR